MDQGGPAAGSTGMNAALSVGPDAVALSDRVDALDGLLKLLDFLPAEEPTPGLADRTCRRCAEAESRPRTAAPAQRPASASLATGTRPANSPDAPEGA
jgi:hypothetical protein